MDKKEIIHILEGLVELINEDEKQRLINPVFFNNNKHSCNYLLFRTNAYRERDNGDPLFDLLNLSKPKVDMLTGYIKELKTEILLED